MIYSFDDLTRLINEFSSDEDGDFRTVITSDHIPEIEIYPLTKEKLQELLDEYAKRLQDAMTTLDEQLKKNVREKRKDNNVFDIAKTDDEIMVLMPGVKDVEVHYIPEDHVLEIETGEGILPEFANKELTIKVPKNKVPNGAKMTQGVLVISLKDRTKKAEQLEVEFE